MYDVIIVGGGIAGLTAAAYLTKDNKKVLLLEKEDKVGGLVSTFEYKEFTFDGGIRSIENSGILFPMLKDLDIKIPFSRSIVSLGLENEIITIDSKDAVDAYQQLLINKFPEDEKAIKKIVKTIYKLMDYLDILYGIDNPLFLDFKRDRAYIIKTMLPWMFKFMFTVGKIGKYDIPIETFIASITKNEALNQVISQHFFNQTPTFFALSYFSLYLDYNYPKNGTGMVIDAIKDYIINHGGEIKTNTEIINHDLTIKTVIDQNQTSYQYEKLLWAANLKHLYEKTNLETILNNKTKQKALFFKNQISNLRGGDSIQTTYMMTDLDPSYFSKICTGHFFYTPKTTGDGSFKKQIPHILKSHDQHEIMLWVKGYLENTTFEISMPAVRNEKLAPKGKTGLIVSVLMSFDLVKHIKTLGFYDLYKTEVESIMVDILSNSIFPKLKKNTIETFSSSPLTILSRTNNLDGAITGWAFTNNIIPTVTSMLGVSKSVNTYIPNVYQAGQWSYSPAGLPISILTGKLAANKISKSLK